MTAKRSANLTNIKPS